MSRILPILFNGKMVKAILDGRKTVTRRINKDGNDFVVPDMDFFNAEKRTYAVHNYADKEHTDKLSIAERTCPICIGDILYVRETWNQLPYSGEYIYKATDIESVPSGEIGHIKYKPSIYMPKEAARIWLRVTDVRVERLQDITEKQARCEGIEEQQIIKTYNSCFKYAENPMTLYGVKSPELYCFNNLWDSTIKKSDLDTYGWNANPYVWVIEFERCEKPKEEC